MAEAPARPPRARDARDPPLLSADETWDRFSQKHDHCYIVTDQALEADSRGMTTQAIEGYQRALDLMDEALAMEANDNERIINMQNKIRRAKKETLSRLVDAQSAYATSTLPPPPGAGVPPPSYDSLYPTVPAAGNGTGTGTGMYPTVPPESSTVSNHLAVRVAAEVEDAQAVALMEIAEEADGGCVSVPEQAELLFSLSTGAQIFFVAPDGSVSAPSTPAPLQLCRFHAREAATPGTPTAFLQVGDWTYPLIPGCSPVLHSNFGPYMFPDLQRPGHHVAVLLPETVSSQVRREFEALLSDLTALVTQPPGAATPPEAPAVPPPPHKEGAAAKISGGLVKGAELVSRGLVAGADKLSRYMASGTQKLQAHLGSQHASEPAPVHPHLRSGAETARKVGTGALKVSEYVVTQVGRGTMSLASYIAPHVKRTGTRLLTSTRTASDVQEANSKMDSALEVASGAVRGFGMVYMGLEQAATILARSFANNTVTLVETRYGAEAGQVTEDSLYAAGNLAMTGHNVQSLGAKGIAKRVVKDTGKHIISEHEQKKNAAGQQPPS